MYTNFKSPLFQKHDVMAINSLFKESIQACADNPTSQNLKILSRALDYFFYSEGVPLFIEEIFRTASPGILTQLEMLNLRLNKWPQSENRDQVLNSLKNLFKKLFNKPSKILQQYTSKSKAPNYVLDEPLNAINLVQYFGDSLSYSDGQFTESYQVLLRVFRISLLFYDKARQEGQNTFIPEQFFFFLSNYIDKDSIQQNKWDRLIQNLVQILSDAGQNQENQVRILDLLIFFQRDNQILKQIIVEQGCLRMLTNKCSDQSVSLEVALRTLLLLRDICQGDWVTTDLVSRYETEKHLMKLMQKFRADQQIADLISQILELLIKGYELDLENMENTLKQTKERLQKYNSSKNLDLDPHKALTNVEILRFYSLMTIYVKKIVEHKIDETLIDLLLKEHSLNLQTQQDLEGHLRLIIANNMVLEKIVINSDSFANPEKLELLIQQIKIGIENINKISRILKINTVESSIHSDCIQTYLSLLQICLSSEHTKVIATLQCNILNQTLLEAKQFWEHNQQLSKTMNSVISVIAKSSTDQAEQIVKKLVIKDAIAKLSQPPPNQQTNQNKLYSKNKQTIEFIASLSDIPQATAQIIQSKEGLQCIIEVLTTENKFMVGLFPECAESQVDDKIYMLDLGIKDDGDTDQLDLVLMKAENPEQLREVLYEKKRLLVSTMVVLRKLMKNEQFKKQAVTEQMLREVLGFLRLFSKERNQCITALRILNEVAGEESFQALLQENKGIESIFFALNDHPTDKDVIELAGNVLKQLSAEEIAKSVKDQFDGLRQEFDPKNQQSLSAVRQASIYLANLMAAAPEEETPQIVKENKALILCISAFLLKSLPREELGALLLLVSRMATQGEETKKLLRHSDIPKKIISIVFMEKTFLLDRIPGFAIDAISNMIGGGQETVNVLDYEGLEYEQETNDIRGGYLNPIQQLFLSPNNIPLIYLISMLNKQVIGQANFADLKGAAASFNDDQNKSSLSTLYDNSSNRAITALESIEKSSQLISKLCRNDKRFSPIISEMHTNEYCIQIFRELCDVHLLVQVKAQVFMRCGSILAELSRSNPQIFVQVCLEDTIMISLGEIIDKTKIDDIFVNNLPQMEEIQGVLRFLNIFLDNKFDKALISKREIPQKISKLVKRFLDYYTTNIVTAKDNAFLGIILRDTLQVMYQVLLDPIMAKEQKPETYIIPIQKFLEASLKLEQKREDPDDGDDVFGSGDPFVRIIENCYRVIDQSFSEIRICHYYGSQFSENEEIVNVALYHYNNSFLVCKGLSILKKLSLTLDDSNIKTPWNQRMMYLRKNFKQYQEVTVLTYPKIATIANQYNQILKILTIPDQKSYEQARNVAFGLMLNASEVDVFQKELKGELKQFETASKITQEVSLVKDDTEMLLSKKRKVAGSEIDAQTAQITTMAQISDITDVVKSLDRIANALDIILQKALIYTAMTPLQQKTQDVDWISVLLKLIQAVKEFVKDNQTASKVHQIEVTNILLSLLMMDDLINNQVNHAIIDCLAHISQFQEALKSYENKINLYEPYVSYSTYLLSVQDPQVNKCIQRFFVLMKNAVILEEIQQKIIKTSQVQPLVRIFVHSVGNNQAMIDGAECLDRFGFSEKISQIYFEEGAAKVILDWFPRNYNVANFASAFCLLIGTISRFQSAQALLSQNKIHQTIIDSMAKHPNDIKLLSNYYYAISGLCFNNKSLTTEIMSSPLPQYIKSSLSSNQLQSPVLVETICSTISNLTFRNDQNKLAIGHLGLVEHIYNVFVYYSFQHPEFRPRTLKQILRALGNVCFLYENSVKLVNSGFLFQSIKLIDQKLQQKEQGEVIRYTLDVYANLCSHPEDQNRSNIERLIKDGMLDAVLSILKKNVLSVDIVMAGMDTLDGLVQSKLASQLVVEKSAIDIIIKINRSHDWNDVIVGKCFRLLANLSILKQNIDYYVEAKVPRFLTESVRNLKLPTPKLLTYAYKILHRIAGGQKGKENELFSIGFIEAAHEILQKKGIYDNHLELIQLINRASQSDEALEIVAIRTSSNILQKIPEAPVEHPQTENFIRECLCILERIFKRPQLIQYVEIKAAIFVFQTHLNLPQFFLENKAQILKCVIAMCDSNQNCRELCIQYHLDMDITKLKKQEKLTQIQQAADQALQSIYRNKEVPQDIDSLKISSNLPSEHLKILLQGFPIKLYRTDGSFKTAQLQITADYSKLIAKQNGGVVKKKYELPLLDISFTQFDYAQGGSDWKNSNFSKGSARIMADQCITVNGKMAKQGDVIQINAQLVDVASKLQFETSLNGVIYGLKNGTLKLKQ